jgi:predicted enzyme related to lactoylglutathione lyase
VSDVPPIAQQIAWIYTEDLERSADFYGRVLGLEQLVDQGSARIYRSAAGARIGICRVYGDRAAEPSGSMLSFVTDEVDAWYDRLVAAGVQTRGPPRVLAQFGIYAFFAEDPSGYVVEFQRFLDG